MVEKIIFVSVVRNFDMYDIAFRNNPFISRNGIYLHTIDNSKHNEYIGKKYNEFLNQYEYSNSAWLVFCHEDWDILEDVREKINILDKKGLYGTFGARLLKNDNKNYYREYIGSILDCAKDGSNLRRLGSNYENLTTVDTIDCQALIVHSSLVKKYGLRFDENLKFDFYVEDFCLQAFTKNNIISHVVDLKVCHHSQISSIIERPNIFEKKSYINEKYKGKKFAGIVFNIGDDNEFIESKELCIHQVGESDRSIIYQNSVPLENDARRIAINYMNAKTRVLDVGCACGDFAIALKKEKSLEIWGMEYNQDSIDIARTTHLYEDIFQIDLNYFNGEKFIKFHKSFDYIVFGDVLEHLLNPQEVLRKFTPFLSDKGAFILSIPNVAHASIKANLMLDDFTYTPYGLLDETHVHFFTHKTIPVFLSDIYLEINKTRFTYMGKIGTQSTDPYPHLSKEIKKTIFEDVHSYILQYVILVKKSRLSKKKIFLHNERNILEATQCVPNGLLSMMKNDNDELELNSLQNQNGRGIANIKNKLGYIESNKFWKLQRMVAYLKNALKFVFLSPDKFIKKHILKQKNKNSN